MSALSLRERILEALGAKLIDGYHWEVTGSRITRRAEGSGHFEITPFRETPLEVQSAIEGLNEAEAQIAREAEARAEAKRARMEAKRGMTDRRRARAERSATFVQAVLARFAGVAEGAHWFTHPTEGFCDALIFATEMRDDEGLQVKVATVLRMVDQVLLDHGIRLRNDEKRSPLGGGNGEAHTAAGRFRRERPKEVL